MKITSQGKQWLQSERGIKPDATEQEFTKGLVLAFAEDKITGEKFHEFTTDEDAKNGGALKNVMDQILNRLDGNSPPKNGLKNTAPKMPGTDLDTKGQDDKGGITAYERSFIGGIGEDTGAVTERIKGAHEQYDKNKKSMNFPDKITNSQGIEVKHPFAGRRLFEGGTEGKRFIDEPSELERAMFGAFWKYSMMKSNHNQAPHPRLKMTDHDHDLMNYCIQNEKWCGVLNSGSVGGTEVEGSIGLSLQGEKLSPKLQKTLLDDSTSGGLYATPIFFDDMMVTTPLLYGELFPKVNVVNINRGRRIEGASMSNVTLSAGTEGTAVSLFNTANFIAAFNCTIFICTGAIEIGLDHLSDSPIDLAAAVGDSYQRAMLKWLDDKIATGNGTTEPEGVKTASGTVTVNSANGAGGPWTVGDMEALLFGVAKQYKTGYDPNRIGYAANETTYRRIRGIAVGTSDQRRVFGMKEEDYRLFDRFFGINASFGNRDCIFGNWARYRMYRRMGIGVRWETSGKTLGLTNTGLMIARSRWGGHIESGSAFSYASDGQS